MSYRDIQKRLAALEREAAQTAQQAYEDWLESLSAADLDALCAADAEHDPVGYAAMKARSEAELDRLIRQMSAHEWDVALLQDKERLAALYAEQEHPV